MSSPQASGAWAEQLAQAYLEENGLRVEARNYRCRFGEIDLVLRDTNTLVFVEVRYRARTDFGSGAETVNHAKRRRILTTAEHYLQRGALPHTPACRFDVVSVSGSHQAPFIDWIKDAFQ